MAAQGSYSAVIMLPKDSGKFLKSERRARSTITVKRAGASIEVKVSANDATALKATMSSVIKDVAIIDAVSSAIKHRGK